MLIYDFRKKHHCWSGKYLKVTEKWPYKSVMIETKYNWSNGKFQIPNDPKSVPLGNKLEILIISSLTQWHEFPNAETVSCGGVATLEMAWTSKKLLIFFVFY